jgi:transcriptional regulator with PAS, ATPase and Fis domain
MPLFEYYTEVFNKKYDKEVKFNPGVKEELINYEWPGNVREMINLLERIIVTTENSQIVTKDRVKKHLCQKNIVEDDKEIIVKDIVPLKEAVNLVEKEILKLAKNRKKTTYEIADILGVNQSTVVRKMKKYFD